MARKMLKIRHKNWAHILDKNTSKHLHLENRNSKQP